MRRIRRVSGRSDDMLIVRGVNVFPSQVEELVLKTPGLAPHYQIELTREGRMDHLTVHVETVPDWPRASSDLARVESTLAYHLKSYIGVSAEVRVHEAFSIERSTGKAKRVIDKRAPGDP
jgi:phenylacetate-CoA ligase